MSCSVFRGGARNSIFSLLEPRGPNSCILSLKKMFEFCSSIFFPKNSQCENMPYISNGGFLV